MVVHYHRRQGGASASVRSPSVRGARTEDLRVELNRRRAGEDACISVERAREHCLNIKGRNRNAYLDAAAPKPPGNARIRAGTPVAGLPDCLLDDLLHLGIQCRLSRLQLAGFMLGVGTSKTDVGTSGTEVLAVAAPTASVLAVAKPGVGASAAAAGASGATASGVDVPGTGASAAAALGAIGLAEVAAPELPTSAVASAIAVEAPVAWTPADEPAAAEELPGREALAKRRDEALQQKANR
ncbi:uncharacterized protein LOC120667792 [Panicum virgatum]|uniref:uncharacterized protein LOC120667792 n=1 Tax=Panicum virgatum TaxID=38727 RepID=UPI0019D5C363|nr:uncharacterized protein LOC120667792 [Panicum virgatum]